MQGYTPGKLLYTAHTLSCAPPPTEDHDILDEAESFVETTTGCLSEGTSRRLCLSQGNGLLSYPMASEIPLLGLYWKVLDSLSIHNDLLMYNLRIVVPLSLQKETLQIVHEGHQGIVRCRMRTKMSVWWLGISKHVEEFVQRWPICARDREPRREPLTPTPLPDYPWQVIGSDLFQVM